MTVYYSSSCKMYIKRKNESIYCTKNKSNNDKTVISIGLNDDAWGSFYESGLTSILFRKS